ncbi:hypothetical protein K438DRAFT_1753372 [Mycena galopus ATCC 62051]|nr:hypothetical protein K438DRAFT_1753372 [Mycena galopus ATCC 62051]
MRNSDHRQYGFPHQSSSEVGVLEAEEVRQKGYPCEMVFDPGAHYVLRAGHAPVVQHEWEEGSPHPDWLEVDDFWEVPPNLNQSKSLQCLRTLNRRFQGHGAGVQDLPWRSASPILRPTGWQQHEQESEAEFERDSYQSQCLFQDVQLLEDKYKGKSATQFLHASGAKLRACPPVLAACVGVGRGLEGAVA